MKIKKVLALFTGISMIMTGCATASQPNATTGAATTPAATTSAVTAAPATTPAVTAAPATTPVPSAFKGKYLVDGEYVKSAAGKAGVLIIDARGEDPAKAGTVEGAIAMKWQIIANVTGKPGDPMWGTMLEPAALSTALSKFGITKDKEIIVFGAAQKGWGDEGRIVWQLLAAGFPNVKMVDGGLEGLSKAGVTIVKGATAPVPADVVVTEINNAHNINTDALAADYKNFKVVDVRANEEYQGQVLYGEANGGHLPGAIHINFTTLFNADNTLKSNDEITKLFTDAGLSKTDKIVTYCTAGIRSAYMQLIMEMTGFENSFNYDESFYRWSAVNELEK